MISLFIGGSRAVTRLTPALCEMLQSFIDKDCLILVGDAAGADKAVQQFYAQAGYLNVRVYATGAPRNNVGGWPTVRIESESRTRDFQYYVQKDHAMAAAASCGMMLWDGESKGTLNNIQNLLNAGKKTLVYFAPTDEFYKLEDRAALEALLDQVDPAKIRDARRRIAAAHSAGR